MSQDPLKKIRIRKRIEQAQADLTAGNYAMSRKIYEDILAEEGDLPEAVHGLGILCVQERQFDEAARLLHEACQLEPSRAWYWNDLGEAMRMLGRTEDAIEAFCRALDTSPDFVEAMNNLGVALVGKGDLSEAKRWFVAAIQSDPSFHLPQNNMGVVLEGEGKLEEALRYYESAVVCKPDFSEAKENYSGLLTRHPEFVESSVGRILANAVALKKTLET